MPSSFRRPFTLRPHDALGVWESNNRRYRAYAKELLVDLEEVCTKELTEWPPEDGASIKDPLAHPEMWKLARLRDRTSDSIRIYAAMAVEGFLNFYGVLRLGQIVFDEHFERKGLVPKLQSLLLFCDGLQLERNDELIRLLDSLAQGRNALVHPKAKEVVGEPLKHKATSTKVPEVAREAVARMESFFEKFAELVPLASQYVRAGA